ncbi:c-type cytochrome [uncultured Enterovirga sp.]|uniref:c-type cytochrome n=1 Tax=uncultured Enterovirga sp. TaxID=2026352 RepID=UPI0035C9A201
MNRHFRTLALAGVTTCLLAGIVAAQTDPIAARRGVMKGVGAATRTGSQMAKAEIPFDLAKAQEILKIYAMAADTAHTQFPETSKTGGETTASPKIWESQAEFRARFDEWAADIRKAADATKDLPTFQASFGTVTKACGSCHNTYRIKA